MRSYIEHTAVLDLSPLTDGVYFCKAVSAGQIGIVKFSVVKK